jgi:DNA polymerase-3 subunit gamma/tau
LTRSSGPSRPAETDSRTPEASPFARPSPFEADRNRKSEPKAELPPEPIATLPTVTTSGVYAAAAFESETPNQGGTATAVAVQVETAVEPSQEEITPDAARNAILGALEDAGQNMLAHNLEEAEWSVRGFEVSAKVAMSQVLIDIALGPEPKRIIQTAIGKLSSKPLKFKMVSGGTATAPKANGNAAPRAGNSTGARSRAASDPVVQRMQEKFGAEIRTVIDQKDRG